MLALGLLLLVVTAAVYLQVHRHPFVNLDDDGYVTQNAHVNTGLHWSTFGWALTTYYASNWHPLTWISHALDCQLFGVNPAGMHDENVLLHMINVVLLFWVLWKATGYAGRSLMVAALFALHPINVESVAWIAERKTMLSMLFFLLALGAYRWYACKPRVGRYIGLTLLFMLGLMSKPQVITFPCVLLLWDYWPLRRLRFGTEQVSAPLRKQIFQPRSWFALIKEKIPLFVICLIDSYLTMKAQKVGHPQYWPYTFRVRSGKCHCVLCTICAEDVLAFTSGPHVPPSGQQHTVIACSAGFGCPAGGYSAGGGLLASPLPYRRLVMVSGNDGAHGRPHAGGKTIHGRPLCLRAPF